MSNRNPGKGEGDIVNCERALGNLGDSARWPYASCSMKTIHYVPLAVHGGTLDRIALRTETNGIVGCLRSNVSCQMSVRTASRYNVSDLASTQGRAKRREPG